jgi:hypothetical protein
LELEAGITSIGSELLFAALVLYGHSSMDRMLGYGLKYADDFKHTHLGWLGKSKQSAAAAGSE